MKKLDDDEIELLKAYENNEKQSVKIIKERISKFQETAKKKLKKDRRINIRISEKDLDDIKKKAVIQGLPYQTLIASIIHKYNSGLLTEKGE